jgi:hypothetical protein
MCEYEEERECFRCGEWRKSCFVRYIYECVADDWAVGLTWWGLSVSQWLLGRGEEKKEGGLVKVYHAAVHKYRRE